MCDLTVTVDTHFQFRIATGGCLATLSVERGTASTEVAGSRRSEMAPTAHSTDTEEGTIRGPRCALTSAADEESCCQESLEDGDHPPIAELPPGDLHRGVCPQDSAAPDISQNRGQSTENDGCNAAHNEVPSAAVPAVAGGGA